MRTCTNEELHNAFNALPENVQNFVLSDAVALNTAELQRVGGLTEVQVDALGKAITMVLVGLATEMEFTTFVAQQLNLPKERSDAVLAHASKALFEPLHKALQASVEATKKPVPDAADTTTEALTDTPVAQTRPYDGVDPYREPVH